MENTDQTKASMSPKQELGNIIKNIREKNNLTQAEVAKKFNVSQEFLQKIENGDEDENRTNSHNRMWVTRFLKRMDEYNEENKSVVKLAYPQNIEEEMKIQANVAPRRRGTASIDKKPKRKTAYEPSNEKKKGSFKKFLAFLIVLLIVIYVLFSTIVFAKQRIVKESSNQTTLVENTTLKPQKTASDSTKGADTVVTKGGKTNGVQTYTISKLPDADQYNLEIDVQGDAYISVYDLAKSNIFLNDATIYKKDEKINLTINDIDNLIINAGYAANLKIKVNDVTLDTSVFPKDQLFVKITNNAK